jgi:hypothetical protein
MIDPGQVLDQQWAERYVAGQLTPEEVREFEETMLGHPEVLEQVEHARTVKLGLRTLRDRGELEKLVGAHPKRNQWWFAAAAAIMVCAFGLFWLKGNEPRPILATSLEQLAAGRSHVSATNDFLVVRTRGAKAVQIEASSDDPVVALRILTSAVRAGLVHHVELLQGNISLAKVDAVPNGDQLTIYLDTLRLDTGDYGLRLTTDDERIPETTYSMHLTRK